MKRAVSALAVIALCSSSGMAHTASSEEVPDFVAPTPTGAHFFETFGLGWSKRWKYPNSAAFPGRFTGKTSQTLKGETSIVTVGSGRRYGLSSAMSSAFDPSGQGLVIQYEVKLNEGKMSCGGAYIKLVSTPNGQDKFVPKRFQGDSPFSVMFGPDKCGKTNKIHLIFQHFNPITEKWEEKQLKKTPNMKQDFYTHLYTVAIKPDSTGELLIDNKKVMSFDMRTDFDPPFEPPQSINDPTDNIPLDWVREAEIPDMDAVKPDDWDEWQPLIMVDEDAPAPEGWDESIPRQIYDPDAPVPDDWDVENDGDYEGPAIRNPACDAPGVTGCGSYNSERPMKRNPLYVGKWKRPMIPNPEFIGKWEPRQLPNPNFFAEPNPIDAVRPITGVGFDLLVHSENVEFDNIFVGTNAADAKAWARKTWRVKKNSELIANGIKPKKEYDSNLEGAIEYIADNLTVIVVSFVVSLAGMYWFLFRGFDGEIFAPSSTSVKKSRKTTTTTTTTTTTVEHDEVEDDDERNNLIMRMMSTSRPSLYTKLHDEDDSEEADDEVVEEEVSSSITDNGDNKDNTVVQEVDKPQSSPVVRRRRSSRRAD